MTYRRVLLGLGLLVAIAAFAAWRLHRRALPVVDGRVRTAGLQSPVEIVRDTWGVPHIFAESPREAYFGLGYATAQDRLFQLELHRRIGQGRLAELFGKAALPADRLFRTMDLHGIGRRQLAAARPDVREAFAAYAEGVNAAVRASGGRLPIEFTLLGQTFQPAAADDFVGVIGYMAWTLNASWELDPLFEDLVARMGEEKAQRLFPYDRGGDPPVHPPPAGQARTGAAVTALIGLASGLAGSNTWVVGPSRSVSGHALLANDPHLKHGVPSIWYEAHLHAPGLEVAGVSLPGLPFIAIGHNRRVAWGLTNVMLDAADFFVERLEGTPPQRVQHRGQWVPLGRRRESIRVKGEADVVMDVLETPHGPLVNHLLEKSAEPLSYSWVHAVASGHANELEGVFLINHAHDWASFRQAASRLGAVAQNISYADVDGHIGLQTTGHFPRRRGRWDGNRFRTGWDGTEDWDGFVPFEDLPHSFDPPSGWLAAANNVTWPEPLPYFISSHWEPPDRFLRIRERLTHKARLSLDDLRDLQADVTVASWPSLRDAIRSAFAASPPAEAARPSFALVRDWDGTMSADSAAAAVFGAFYERLYTELVGDEMGPAAAAGYRGKANLWAIMIGAALTSAPDLVDDVRTPEIEGTDAIIRRAFESAAADLRACCGDASHRWAWGDRHTLELAHPLGAGGALLRAYFNRGPFPADGHVLTVSKAEFVGGTYEVGSSPSMRQLVDMGRVAEARSMLPAGQSGIPASPHYDDQIERWRRVEHHPLLMDRAAIDAARKSRLVLEP